MESIPARIYDVFLLGMDFFPLCYTWNTFSFCHM